MKVKRLLALILIFTLFGVATVFADTVYEKYIAKKITVKVNGASLDSGLMVDIYKKDTRVETPMVNLEELAGSIGGIVSKHDKGINIYKPNVQMSVASPGDNKSIRVVEKGIKLSFNVFAYMDSILTDISNIKVSVVDPFGSEVESLVYILAKEDQGKEVFSYFTNVPMEVRMKYNGNYSVNLEMKEVGGSQYYKVGQYVIYSE